MDISTRHARAHILALPQTADSIPVVYASTLSCGKDQPLPIANLTSARIHYRLLGDVGPWVVIMVGGRHPVDIALPMAKTLARQGFRVVLYDRRNCGCSSLNFKDLRPEEDAWVEDLLHLLDHLAIEKPVLIGQSRSARVAISFAFAFPERAAGLGLWGIGGGPLAVRILTRNYYGRYLEACAKGGMAEVIKLPPFSQMVEKLPQREARLLSVKPAVFQRAMTNWRTHFKANAHHEMIGFSDDTLRTIKCPTQIVPLYDRLHPIGVAQHAHALIENSAFCDVRHGAEGATLEPEEQLKKDQRRAAGIFGTFFKSL